MSQVSWLDIDSLSFPDTKRALSDPNGLLAVGGDLSPRRLLAAYSLGIFPWFSDDQPLLWWSPSPRMILRPDEIHIGRSLRKLANKKLFKIKVDTEFYNVVSRCASSARPGTQGTWITDDIHLAYTTLHHLGYTHSIEAWQDNKLVGGLYGIALGGVFFGESMFSLVSGASKIAFASLVMQLQDWRFSLIDCQMHTDYLASFGASEVGRNDFELQLAEALPADIQQIIADPEKQALHLRNWQRDWNRPEHGLG